jgi:hypothetical protein
MFKTSKEMLLKKIFTSLLLIFSTQFFLFGQFKIGGYFSSKYEKSQSEGLIPNGNISINFLSVNFYGRINSKFEFFTEIRTENSISKIFLEQAWIGFKAGAFLNIKTGAYLVPFGKYNQFHRPLESRLIDYPLPKEQIGPVPWSDIGILIEGNYGIFSYSTYLGNGLGESENIRKSRQYTDNNSDKARGGRLSLSLSQGLEIGYSRYKGAYNSEGDLKLTLEGVDISWLSSKMLLFAEYSRVNLENPSPYEKGKAEGYFILFSFSVGNFFPVFSYQKVNYNDPYHGTGFLPSLNKGLGIKEDKSRWTIGLNFYPVKNIVFKVEYQFNKEKDLELNNDKLLIQSAISF